MRWRSGASKCREDVETPNLEIVASENYGPLSIEVPRQPRNPGEDFQGLTSTAGRMRRHPRTNRSTSSSILPRSTATHSLYLDVKRKVGYTSLDVKRLRRSPVSKPALKIQGTEFGEGRNPSPTDLAVRHFEGLEQRVALGRASFGRPLSTAEKILVSHLRSPNGAVPIPGETYAEFQPDRVALQDALAQIVALQFITAGLDEVVVPTTVHLRSPHHRTYECRHRPTISERIERRNLRLSPVRVRPASAWASGSPAQASFIRSWLENYAFPGGMMIGTDSHTPNAGGLAMLSVGVGGGDAIDVMTGLPFTLRWPTLIGVRLSGELSGWASPKDVILKVAECLGVSGGTGAIVEYFGPGAATLSATGKATICNMGAEIGATTSIFPYDENTAAYLRATSRSELAERCDEVSAELRADPEIEHDPSQFFDTVIDVDLSTLRTPHQWT